MCKIVCEACQEQGLKSTVQSTFSMSTCIACNGFYDENGDYHFHDQNITTVDFVCSNGHKFIKKSSSKCWCGWQKV